MKISEVCNEVLLYLDSWGFLLRDFLNEPLSPKDIGDLFYQVNLRPTSELVELYQWKNGTLADQGVNLDDIQIIPGFHLSSLDDAISNYIAMRSDVRWNENWFPLFSNGGGDFYAVDLSMFNSNNETAPIIGFVLGEVEQFVEYESLMDMLLTFYNGYKKGIIFRSDDGYLEMNDDEFYLAALELNPNVDYWKL